LHTSPPSILRSQLSNKTNCKAFGVHLVGQPSPNLQPRRTGCNPALGRKWVCLDDLLNSIFYETLGYEITSKYLSNHARKVEIKDQLVLLLSSLKKRENPFARVKSMPGYLLDFGVATCATC